MHIFALVAEGGSPRDAVTGGVVNAVPIFVVGGHALGGLAFDFVVRVGGRASLDADTVVEHLESGCIVALLQVVDDLSGGRLGPVKHSVIERIGRVTAAILVRIPSNEQQIGVTEVESVTTSEKHADAEAEEENSEENIGDPAALDRSIAELLWELKVVHLYAMRLATGVQVGRRMAVYLRRLCLD